jgi:hypothetical protein
VERLDAAGGQPHGAIPDLALLEILDVAVRQLQVTRVFPGRLVRESSDLQDLLVPLHESCHVPRHASDILRGDPDVNDCEERHLGRIIRLRNPHERLAAVQLREFLAREAGFLEPLVHRLAENNPGRETDEGSQHKQSKPHVCAHGDGSFSATGRRFLSIGSHTT